MGVRNGRLQSQATGSTEQAWDSAQAEPALRVSREPVVWPVQQASSEPTTGFATDKPRPPVTKPAQPRTRKRASSPASQPARKPAAKSASQASAWTNIKLRYEEIRGRARPALEKARRRFEGLPTWALALGLVVVLVLLVLLARSFSRGPAGSTASQASAQASGLKPLAIDRVDAGVAHYRQVTIRGLSYADGKLSLLGTVQMPKDRYADQWWQVSWVSDDVVGKYGLEATDERIAWYPVTGEFRTQDAQSVLATWPVTSDTRCVLHIRLVAKAGSAREIVYAKFDIGSFRPTCIR